MSTNTPAQIRLPLPDDFHIHLRQDAALSSYVQDAATQFGRVLVMPNTLPPVSTPEHLLAYKKSIEDAAPGLSALMTFKLNPNYTAESLRQLKEAGAVAGKYYPAGVTTNSQDGIGDFEAVLPVIAEMEKLDLILCLHGEEPGVFCLDREEAFLKRLEIIVQRFPKLRIVLEHLSSKAAVDAVAAWPSNVSATLTVHHLMFTLDDLIGDGLMPHHFCKPVVKRPEDRQALLNAAFSGSPKFFLGTDSAPHSRGKKECPCGAAGVYSAPVAMPLLIEIFTKANAMDKLTNFVAGFGADFYGLPRPTKKLVLENSPWVVPNEVHGVVPLHAGAELQWKIVGIED